MYRNKYILDDSYLFLEGGASTNSSETDPPGGTNSSEFQDILVGPSMNTNNNMSDQTRANFYEKSMGYNRAVPPVNLQSPNPYTNKEYTKDGKLINDQPSSKLDDIKNPDNNVKGPASYDASNAPLNPQQKFERDQRLKQSQDARNLGNSNTRNKREDFTDRNNNLVGPSMNTNNNMSDQTRANFYEKSMGYNRAVPPVNLQSPNPNYNPQPPQDTGMWNTVTTTLGVVASPFAYATSAVTGLYIKVILQLRRKLYQH